MASLMQEFRVIGGTREAVWRSHLAAMPIRPLNVESLVTTVKTVHILAPHPDDEILIAAGLLQRLAGPFCPGRSSSQTRVIIYALTDGEASHPRSREWPPLKLIQTRREESLRALRTLAIPFERRRLSLPDGALADFEEPIEQELERCAHKGDLLITPWRFDGHPDHEAAGRAAHRIAHQRGLRLFEAPIWGWERCIPDDGAIPLERARRLDLRNDEHERKREAIACFKTQLESDPSTGKPPILSADTLAHFTRNFEIFIHAEF